MSWMPKLNETTSKALKAQSSSQFAMQWAPRFALQAFPGLCTDCTEALSRSKSVPSLTMPIEIESPTIR